MITLRDIPSELVLENNHFEKLQKLLDKHHPETVEDVKLLTELYPDMYWGRVIPRIKECEYRVRATNMYKKEPIKYQTTKYTDDTLEYVDTLNTASILPLSNPTTNNPFKYRKVNNTPISTIKRELKFSTPNGNNYFMNKNYNIGVNSIDFFISIIKMYEQQVIINSRLTNDRTTNLFLYQHDAKREWIKDYYNSIIYELIHYYANTIWTPLTHTQKEAWKKTVNSKSEFAKEARNKMVEYLTNYNTLEEIEKLYHHDYSIIKKLTK